MQCVMTIARLAKVYSHRGIGRFIMRVGRRRRGGRWERWREEGRRRGRRGRGRGGLTAKCYWRAASRDVNNTFLNTFLVCF